MDKYKLKPIEYKKLQRYQVSRKEAKTTIVVASPVESSDIRFHILPNLSKSPVLSKITESISTLNKWIKLQKHIAPKHK